MNRAQAYVRGSFVQRDRTERAGQVRQIARPIMTGFIARDGGMAEAKRGYPWLIMGGAAVGALLIGLAGWNQDRFRDMCDALAPLISAKASAASAAPASLADDKVIRISAYCYDEGGRRICYAQ
jgi:hypothetical protein